MLGFTAITVLGRVGKQPETRAFTNGNRVADLSLATTRRHTGRNGQTVENTSWHRVRVYNERLIETVIPHIAAGDALYVEGELVYETFADRNNARHKDAVIEIRYQGRIQLLPNGHALHTAETREDAQTPRPTNPPAGNTPSRGAPAAARTPVTLKTASAPWN